MPFKKGQSGNPGGKKRLAPEQQDARRLITRLAVAAVPAAWERIKKNLESGDDKVAQRSAEFILQMGGGKPANARDDAELRELQAKKMNAEIRLIEKRIAEGAPPEGPALIPGTADFRAFLLERWGFDRAGRKAVDDGEEEADAGSEPARAD